VTIPFFVLFLISQSSHALLMWLVGMTLEYDGEAFRAPDD